MPLSVISAATVAVLVGFGGTLAIIVAAARNLGADGPEIASWIWALCGGIGISSIVLSLWSRQPMVTAWSLAGAVLMAGMPAGTTMAQAVGAFLAASALTILSGAVPWLGALVSRLPTSIGAAMLAGLLLRFVLAPFPAAAADPLLVLPLLALFLLTRELHAASAALAVILAGFPLAALTGHPLPYPQLGLAIPHWTTPDFSPVTLLGLGLPLFLVTMATQQIPGAAVLRAAGYDPPVRGALLLTGGLTLLLAPFGGYSVNLSSLTAALCTSPDAHPDPAQRWRTGPIYGVLYLVLALFGAGFAAMLAALPPALVAVIVGAAMMGPMTNALTTATAVPNERFAAIAAFVVTASNAGAFGLGGAFWGLVAGVAVLAVERYSAGRRAGSAAR